jgi:membrane protease YdiL (CAAX protease family)
VTAETWAEIGRMAVAGGIVAAFAVPFGLIAAAVVRRRRIALLPKWKLWRVPWGGFEVFAVFAVVVVLVPSSLIRYCGVAEGDVSLAAFPIQLALLLVAWRVFYPRWKPFRRDAAVFKGDAISLEEPIPIGAAFARAMTLAILAWAILTPLVLAIHGLANWLFTQLGVTPEQHPLTNLDRGEGWAQVSLLLQACLTAPVIEELAFRGILLAWMVGARERNTGGLHAKSVLSPQLRPLVVMGIAVIDCAMRGKTWPIVFAGALSAGLFVLWLTARHGRRHWLAVYVSAAFFGLVHSGVWPSPIPLFFLGLGLGWLAVRTRGVLVPIVVHGLFNAVSAVFVLRSAT